MAPINGRSGTKRSRNESQSHGRSGKQQKTEPETVNDFAQASDQEEEERSQHHSPSSPRDDSSTPCRSPKTVTTNTDQSPESAVSNRQTVPYQGRAALSCLKNLSESKSIHVDLKMNNGEYVLKLRNAPASTEINRAEQLAQNGATLLFQAEMLRKLGEKLLSQFQASFQSLLEESH